MTMNMASSSFKSTGGSVSVALVVLLVAVMAAETSAQQRFRITFANELAAPLTVTVPATEFGPSKRTTIPARSDRTSVVFAAAVLEANFKFQVGRCVYATKGSIQGRGNVEMGFMKMFFTGHCEGGEPGLQFLVTIKGQGVTNFACAAPVDANCAG